MQKRKEKNEKCEMLMIPPLHLNITKRSDWRRGGAEIAITKFAEKEATKYLRTKELHCTISYTKR